MLNQKPYPSCFPFGYFIYFLFYLLLILQQVPIFRALISQIIWVSKKLVFWLGFNLGGLSFFLRGVYIWFLIEKQRGSAMKRGEKTQAQNNQNMTSIYNKTYIPYPSLFLIVRSLSQPITSFMNLIISIQKPINSFLNLIISIQKSSAGDPIDHPQIHYEWSRKYHIIFSLNPQKIFNLFTSMASLSVLLSIKVAKLI